MKNKICGIIALLLIMVFALSGCGSKTEIIETTEENKEESTTASRVSTETLPESQGEETEYSEEETISDELEEYFTERDLSGTFDESDATEIKLASDDINITEEGIYIITGTLSNGSIIIEVEDTEKVQLVLENVSITSEKSAAIYVKSADKVFITIPEGTTSVLSNGGSFEAIDENNIDAVIFSKDDIVINGTGTLNINSPAAHGIVSKGDLKLCGAEITIDSLSTAIDGKDSLRISDGIINITSQVDGIKSSNEEEEERGYIYICGGDFSIKASDDGIYAESDIFLIGGTFTINADDDAIHAGGNSTVDGGEYVINAGDDAIHSDSTTTINAGTINIESSYEGIEGQAVEITGGDINLISSDDGINAAGGNDSSGDRMGWFGGQDMFGGASSSDYYIRISGGVININAEGDGVDSNGSLEVTGGELYIDGPTNSGNGALDYGTSATVSGGTVIAVGASGMAEGFSSDSTQGSILYVTNNYSGGTLITLSDENGNEILNWTSSKSFSSVVISCPEITIGSTYTLVIGSDTTEITMNSTVYSNGQGGMGQGGDGMRGGGMGQGGGGMQGGMGHGGR